MESDTVLQSGAWHHHRLVAPGGAADRMQQDDELPEELHSMLEHAILASQMPRCAGGARGQGVLQEAIEPGGAPW